MSTASNARSPSRRHMPTVPHRPHVSVLARRLSSTRCVARTTAVATKGSATSRLAVAGEMAGQAGATYLGVSPLHMLSPAATEAGRAPTIHQIANSSTLYSSTCRTIQACRATRRSPPCSRHWRRSLPPLRRQLMSSTRRCGSPSARRSKLLERGLHPPSRRAAKRPAHRGLPCLREIGRNVATLRRVPSGRQRRSRPKLGSLAAGSAQRRPKGDRPPYDRTQPPRL